MRIILAFTALLAIGICCAQIPVGILWNQPASAPTTLTVTEICKKISANCVVTATVPINGFVVICQMNESGTFAAPTDSSGGSNTYGLDLNQNNAGGAGLAVACYHSHLAAALTSGVSTVTWGGSYNNYFAFSVTGLSSFALDTGGAVGANQSNTTAFNSGATSAVSGTDACFGISGQSTSATFAADTGAGFALLDSGSTIINDGRTIGAEWKQVSSGAVTATGTVSTLTSGTMSALCYK